MSRTFKFWWTLIMFFLFWLVLICVLSKKSFSIPKSLKYSIFCFPSSFSFSSYVLDSSLQVNFLCLMWDKNRSLFLYMSTCSSTIYWKTLWFLHWCILVPWSEVSWPYVCGSVSRLCSVPLIYLSVWAPIPQWFLWLYSKL